MEARFLGIGIALLMTAGSESLAGGISLSRSSLHMGSVAHMGSVFHMGSTMRMPGTQMPAIQGQPANQLRGGIFGSGGASGGSFAQQHPRRAEVLGRDRNLNNTINGDRGHLNGQYNHLENQDRAINNQEQNYASQNGGYITQGQQAQLNREENALHNEVRYDNTNSSFVQNHPRRAEVLSRDSSLNYQINKDEGHLGGHYNQLMSQDRAIQSQEQTYASQNGGYITQAQQAQLNQEENALHREIRYDNTSGF